MLKKFLLTLVFHANRTRIVSFFVATCFVDKMWGCMLLGICLRTLFFRRTMFFVTFFGLLVGDYDVKGGFVKLT